MMLVEGYLIESIIFCFFYTTCLYSFFLIRKSNKDRGQRFLLIGAIIGLLGKSQRLYGAIFGSVHFENLATLHWIDITTTSIALIMIAIFIIKIAKSD